MKRERLLSTVCTNCRIMYFQALRLRAYRTKWGWTKTLNWWLGLAGKFDQWSLDRTLAKGDRLRPRGEPIVSRRSAVVHLRIQGTYDTCIIPLSLTLSRHVDARYQLEFWTAHAGKKYAEYNRLITHILSWKLTTEVNHRRCLWLLTSEDYTICTCKTSKYCNTVYVYRCTRGDG